MQNTFLVPMRCAVTGGQFLAHFEWINHSGCYVIVDVLRSETAQAKISREGLRPSPNSIFRELGSNQFDFTGFYCPLCGWSKTLPSTP